MKRSLVVMLVMLFSPLAVNAANGMLSIESQFDVETTADRLEKMLVQKGMTIFNRVRHSESAGKVGIQLNETQLIIFGNPKAGSPLMKCQQTVAIDLPQKALIRKDENNKVWISYNDIRYLVKRHGVQNCTKVISKIEKLLASITRSAASQ